ncbi:MAG: two-component regulator propeller domain-containing protein [Candidatus Omnitrophota bacterium]
MKKIHDLILLLVFIGCLFLPSDWLHPAPVPLTADIKFKHISIDQGLSQVTITCILQDRHGFMWFGTQDGLNKYDGYAFTSYKYDNADPQSLSDNYIRVICEDTVGHALWIATRGGGLNKFDPDTGVFTHYRADPSQPARLSNDEIITMCQDKSGALWIGTQYGGLNRFDKATGRWIHYRHHPHDPHSLASDTVTAIVEDRQGNIWVGFYDSGLDKFDRKTQRFTHYRSDPRNPDSLNSNYVTAICETRDGPLWVGTYTGGLNALDRKTGRFSHYVHQPESPESLGYNQIRSLYEDRAGRLWIGTRRAGLDLLNPGTGQFVHFRHDPQCPDSLSHNDISSVYEDNTGIFWIGTTGNGINLYDSHGKEFHTYPYAPHKPNGLSSPRVQAILEDASGILWVGTDGGGLNKYDRKTGTFTYYKYDPTQPGSLTNDSLESLWEDCAGVLWVGTSDGGLCRFNKTTQTFTAFRNDPANPQSISNNQVKAIYQDHTGILWVGTWNGLNCLDRRTNTFKHYRHNRTDPGSISNDFIYCIHEDRSGDLWIGTLGGGLNHFDRKTDRFIRYVSQPGNPHSLSSNRVIAICEDRHGILWIATDCGLNRFDKTRHRWETYTVRNGLPDAEVYGIMEDHAGNLWLSTNKGISKFNPRDRAFNNYGKEDGGLQAGEFCGGAYYQTRRGEMFFGGVNGMISFFPDRIKNNPYIPPVIITGFNIFNRPFKGFHPTTQTREFRLAYNQNFFSFRFVALNYRDSESNQYAYKMEGFDREWVYAGNARFAGYHNLDEGTYIFRVKASNNDNLWNEVGASIRIIISPPFWRTWWFRLGSIALILCSAMTVWYIRTSNIRKKNKQLEEINAMLSREIEERKSIEKALQSSEEKYRNIIEHSLDGHYQIDMEGKVLMINPSGVHLLGYNHKDEILGKHLVTDRFIDSDQGEAFLNAIKAQGKVINYEITLWRKNGEPMIVETSSHCVVGSRPNGEAVCQFIEGIFRDITGRKRAEEEKARLQNQLFSAKKMEAIGNLAGGMAHEFNNLIAVIGGNAYMLARDLDIDSPEHKQIKAIVNASNRCATLTNQLLSFSRKQMLNLKPVNLNEMILDLKNSIHRLIKDDVALVIRLEPELSPIRVDPEMMIQVIMGIVENARDAMPDGGILTVQTENVTVEDREGQFVCLSIQDTGIGMDEETVQHIFEPFFTTKEVGQGVGLDLSFVYGTVSQHNGWVDVLTFPGSGTTMKIYLPA